MMGPVVQTFLGGHQMKAGHQLIVQATLAIVMNTFNLNFREDLFTTKSLSCDLPHTKTAA